MFKLDPLSENLPAELQTIEDQTSEYEQSDMGQRSPLFQLIQQGIEQTAQGLKDVNTFMLNDGVDHRKEQAKAWQTLDRQYNNIGLATGTRGVSDIDNLDAMAPYIPDAAAEVVAPFAYAPARLGVAGLRALGREGVEAAVKRPYDVARLQSKGLRTGTNMLGEVAETMGNTAQSEFLKGELKADDQAGGIFDSFSPEALAMETGADAGIFALMQLARIPGAKRRRGQIQNSKEYKAGASYAEKVLKELRDSTADEGSIAKGMAERANLVKQELGENGLEGFADAFQGKYTPSNKKAAETSHKQPKQQANTERPVTEKQKRRNTVEFKALDTEKPLSSILVEGSKHSEPTLSQVEKMRNKLDNIDEKVLNENHKRELSKRKQELDELEVQATKLEEKLTSERVAKLSDTRLRKLHASAKKNTSPNKRNEIFNKRVTEEYKRRGLDTKTHVKFSDAAKEKSNKYLTQKLAEENFYEKDNPHAEATKAVENARKSTGYVEAIDDIISEQNKAYASQEELPDGTKKNLSIKKRREIAKEWFDALDNPTLEQRVAFSDIYNENTERMYSKKKERVERKKLSAKEVLEKQKEAEANPETKSDAETETETKPETKPETHTEKTKPTDTTEAKKSNTFEFKIDKEPSTTDTAKIPPRPDPKSRFSKGLEGSSVQGKEATKAYIKERSKGADAPDVEVDAEKLAKEDPNAMGMHNNGMITLKSWVNGTKLLDHEVLHSIVDKAYDADPKIKKLTNEVMQEVIDNIDNNPHLLPMDKKHLKNIAEDPQELLVTILSLPRYMNAFKQIKSKRPKAKNLLESMVNLLKDIINRLEGAVDNSIAHQMVDLMITQAEWKGSAEAFPNTVNRFSLSTRSPLHKLEPLASKYLKGGAEGAWKIIGALYDRLDNKHSLVNGVKDITSGTLTQRVLMDWEVNGINVIGQVQELANKMHDIDTFTRVKRGYTVQAVKELLPKEKALYGDRITVDENKLATEIMGLDLQVLDKSTIDELIDANFSPVKINELKSKATKNMYAAMKYAGVRRIQGFNYAIEFLALQMLGKQKPKNVRSYAVNNANQIVYNFTNIEGRNKSLETAVDRYVTMHAMGKLKPKELTKLDPDNLREIIAIHKHSVNLFKEAKPGTGSYRKGYLGGGLDPYWEYQYMDAATFNAVKGKEGWQFMAPASEKGFVHAKRRAAYLRYEKGALPTNQYNAKGGKVYNSTGDMLKDLDEPYIMTDETPKQYNRRIIRAGRKKFKGEFEPYYDERGLVTGFRRVMSDSMKRQHLGYQTKISNVLADNIMHTQRSVVYDEIINQVNETMASNITENSSKAVIDNIVNNVGKSQETLILKGDNADIEKAFAKAFLDTHYEKVDPDTRAILPKELKDAAYIHKMYKDELIGYRNDFLSNNRHLRLMEMWWRDAVINFKESVIKKNPVAMVTNMIGNITMLLLEGHNPVTLAAELHKAKKDIDAMYAGVKKINNLELKLAQHKKGSAQYNELKKQINAEQKKLNSSEAAIGLTDGWYQSAIDDIYDAENSSAKPISHAAEAAYKKMIQKTGIKSESYADAVFKSGCELAMTPSSKTGRAAQKFISYSDYSSRLAMYRLKRSQGMSKAEASKLARDAFVDYRRQLPKELNALKVNGVIPFITWAYRMQPVLAKRAIENPIKTGSLMAGYMAMSDEMGFVNDVRIGGWIPQTAFADASIVGGLPLSIVQGDVPSEILVPKFLEYAYDGDFSKLVGVNIR